MHAGHRLDKNGCALRAQLVSAQVKNFDRTIGADGFGEDDCSRQAHFVAIQVERLKLAVLVGKVGLEEMRLLLLLWLFWKLQ